MTRTVLFDLDGTLVDSADGILGSLRAAFAAHDLPWDEAVMDRRLLGPPMYETLPAIVGDAATVAVMPTYRRIYRENGLLRSTPYPGVEELLGALSAAGVRLGLATSKSEPAARDILANLGWTERFAAITGDTPEADRPTKAAVVAEALRRLGDPDPAGVVMVGDRLHDVHGSGAHGISCLGAGWGYGSPGELADAGATAIYATVGELRKALSV
ncbi:HAD hydrolase-like protein [Pseudonocardia ailaonensis]|uniref:HAD hydrolase-like protein n=1 Tax=Pseudonocardia ailaonensis TaxID=367279 RepID=UPI0031D43070